MVRRYLWLVPVVLGLSVCLQARADDGAAGDAEPGRLAQLKKGFKDAAHGVAEGARTVGHAVRDGALEVGHKAKEVGQKIGSGTKETGRKVGEGASETGHKVKAAVKGDGKDGGD